MDPQKPPAVYDYISLVPKAYISVVSEQIPPAKGKSNRNVLALTLSYIRHGTWRTQDRQHYPSPTTLDQLDQGEARDESSSDLLRTASLEASTSSLALQHCATCSNAKAITFLPGFNRTGLGFAHQEHN